MHRMWDEIRRDAIASAVVVAASLVAFLALGRPAQVRHDAAVRVLGELDRRITASTIAVNDMATLIESDSTGAAVYDRPEDELLPDLLQAIAREGERHGVEIVSMTPRAIERFTLPPREGLEGGAEAARLVVHVVARARYRALGEYLEGLESIPILVAVRRLDLRRVTGRGPVIRATFDIETYTLRVRDA